MMKGYCMKKMLLISCALVIHGICFDTLPASPNQNNLRSILARLESQLTMPCDEEIQAITNIDTMHELEQRLRSHYDKINELFQSNGNHTFFSESEYYKAIAIKAKLYSKSLIIYEQLKLLKKEDVDNQKQS